MAASLVRDHGAQTSKSSGTTLGWQVAATVAAGNLLVVAFIADNAASTTTPTISNLPKAAGETASWTRVANWVSTTATAGGGIVGEIWAIQTTIQWPATTLDPAGATISAAVTSKGLQLMEFAGATATLRSTSGTGTSTTTTPASAATSGTAPAIGDLVIGLVGTPSATAPGADQDTTGGGWTGFTTTTFGTSGGSAATNIQGRALYKVPNAAGVQTMNAATITAPNGACIVAFQALQPPTAPTSTPTASDNGNETVNVALPATLQGGATQWDLMYSVDGGATTYYGRYNAGDNVTITSSGTGSLPVVTSSIQWAVRGYNAAGSGSVGPLSSAVVAVPNPPVFTLTSGNTQVTVAVTGRAYAAVYKVYRRTTSVGGAYTLVNTSASQAANAAYSWTDTGLTNGTSYDYVVTTSVSTPTTRESAQSAVAASTPTNAIRLRPTVTTVAPTSGWTYIGPGSPSGVLGDNSSATYARIQGGGSSADMTTQGLGTGAIPDASTTYTVTLDVSWDDAYGAPCDMLVTLLDGSGTTIRNIPFTVPVNNAAPPSVSLAYPASELPANDLTTLVLRIATNSGTSSGSIMYEAWLSVVPGVAVPTTAVGNQVQALFNENAVVGQSDQYLWNDRISVALTRVVRFNDTVSVALTRQVVFNDTVPAGLSRQTIFNDRATVGQTDQYLWNGLASVALIRQALFNDRAVVGLPSGISWADRALIAKTAGMVWNGRATVGQSDQYVWNTLGLVSVGTQDSLVWQVLQTVAAAKQGIFNDWALAALTRQAVFNDNALVGLSRQALFNDRAVVGQTDQYLWNDRVVASLTRQAMFNDLVPVALSRQGLWRDLSAVGLSRQELFNDLVAVGQADQYLWNGLTSVAQTRQALFNERAVAGKAVSTPWNTLALIATTLVGNQESLRWNVVQAIGAQKGVVFNDRLAVGVQDSARWNDRQIVAAAKSVLANDRALVSKTAAVRANVLTTAAATLVMRWAELLRVVKTDSLLWQDFAAVTAESGLTWDVLDAVGRSLDARYTLMTSAGLSADVVFADLAALGVDVTVFWNEFRTLRMGGKRTAMVVTPKMTQNLLAAMRSSKAIATGNGIRETIASGRRSTDGY